MEKEMEYGYILQAAVTEIRAAKINIARQINVAAIGVYWNLGKLLSEKRIEKGYGAGVVKQLSIDLKSEFPDMGLSPRNLWDMKRFYEYYRDASPKLRQSIAVLPWKHNLNKPIGIANFELLLPTEELQQMVLNELKIMDKEKEVLNE